MVNFKSSKLVGTFIKQRRQTLDLSQRALGQMLTPAVTTQFISNLERGVTPLPLNHLPNIAKALQINEAELTSLLEKEYALKLSQRLGVENGNLPNPQGDHRPLGIIGGDYDFIKKIYDAYRNADPKTQQTFLAACENIFGFK